MAIELEKHIQLLKEDISKSPLHIDMALKKGDRSLAALNMRRHFMNNLELGLVFWRQGESPVSCLEEAHRGILQHRELLLGLNTPPRVMAKLPFYCSSYVASLLNAPHPTVDLNDYSETMAPGIFLGNVLLGTDSIENWSQHRDKLPNQRRNALARATFDLYAGMLSGKVTAAEGVAKGEIYWGRRKHDPYHLDSPSLFGGEPLNDRYVDFQLAAVLKHIGSTVPSIHAWRW